MLTAAMPASLPASKATPCATSASKTSACNSADVGEQRGANPFFFGGKDGQPRINRHESHSGYPEPSAHGIQPAWGFSISHADNIRLKRVTLSCMQPDERPWLYHKDTKRLRLKKINSAQHTPLGVRP